MNEPTSGSKSERSSAALASAGESAAGNSGRSLEFHLLRVGSCRHREAVAMRGAPWRLIEFPALCGVFRHPDPKVGVILYDTGYSDAFTRATQRFPERFYRWMTPVQLPAHEQLPAQLGALGISVEDVKVVLISHFHADHVAGLHLFPNARLMCMRADWEWYQGMRGPHARSFFGRLKGVGKGFLQVLLPADIAERLSFAEDAAEADLPGGQGSCTDEDVGLELLRELGVPRDILGDGSLIAVPLPGHSCCQMGLIFREGEGLTFLVSDACWSVQAIRENRPPSRLADSLVHSVQNYARTFDVLCRIAQSAQGDGGGDADSGGRSLTIIPSHCTATFNEWSARRMRQILHGPHEGPESAQ